MERRGDWMMNNAGGSSSSYKGKEKEQQQESSFDVMKSKSQGIVISGNNSWSQGLQPSQVSTNMFLGNSVDGSENSIASSDTPCATRRCSEGSSKVRIEELTVEKDINSQLPVGGGFHYLETLKMRQNQWQQYLYQLGCGSRNENSYGAYAQYNDRLQYRAQNPYTYNQSYQDHGSLMGMVNNTAPINKLAAGAHPMMYLSVPYGCSQWFGRHNLQEKAVVFEQQESHGQHNLMREKGVVLEQQESHGQHQVESHGQHNLMREKGVVLEQQESHGQHNLMKEKGLVLEQQESHGQYNLMKEKGVVLEQQETHGRVSIMDQDDKNESIGCITRASQDANLNSSSRTNNLSSNKVVTAGIAMPIDGISLRGCLRPEQQNIHKASRLNIFRQIVKFVCLAHSKEVVLQNLRPSYFKLFPSNGLKYIGSLAHRASLESGIVQDNPNPELHSSRKRYSEQGPHSNKSQKLNENMMSNQQNLQTRASSNLQFRVSPGSMVDAVKKVDANVQGYDIDSQLSAALTFQLEEKWYASPEELHVKGSTSSNIYSLGILLFELFCCFESWEVKVVAMSNIHNRILPPKFLSENPKEAGFCLWLLHPEPSLRPSASEVLQSELLFEPQEVPLEKQLLSSLDEEEVESELMSHFLTSLNEQKEKQASKLIEEVNCLEADVEEVEKRHWLRVIESGSGSKIPSGSEVLSRLSDTNIHETRALRNDQIENAYFSMRSQIQLPDDNPTTRSDPDFLKRDKPTDRLGSFFMGLCKYARYNKFDLRMTLRNPDINNSANVICSLAFDRDEDYFAAAGVAKKIKIFEFNSLLRKSIDVHYPMVELTNKSRLSCVTWNNYIKNYLVSSDYDGLIQLWDVNTGQGFSQFQEHKQRAWSVEFSPIDPTKFASGSDDFSVKIWNLNEQKSISTIKCLANVCSVHFSPDSTYLLAFGAADHKTYCFDLRNTRFPWCTMGGRGGKAVSYVKFLDSETVVSASTDSTIRLWNLRNTDPDARRMSSDACNLSFNGHTNDKNFVGLSVSDGYIACGSETNEVFAYYRTLPVPITAYKFGSIDPISGHETADSDGQFVSSVCWRKKSNMLVAANSTGSIKLLEMK